MPDSGKQDQGLHDRLYRGEGAALAAAFEQHRQRLWRIVNFRLDRRMAGRIDPDDVLQEAYLAAAGRIEHYAKDGFTSPFLWLRLIVQQTLLDIHRRNLAAQARDVAREVPIFVQYPQATSASLAIHLVGDFTSPTHAAARGELLDRVQSAISAMGPMDQEILALRHFEELTNSEVAQTLQIEPKAASIRYVRALKRLKEALTGLPGILEAMQDG
jgi:RNA polymerase sigma-70 factor (ECF subfamily)